MNVAIVQLCSGRDQERNLMRAFELAKKAVEQGATWIVFPENTPFLGEDREKLGFAEQIDGALSERFSAFAQEFDVSLTVGSFAELCDETHTFNTCMTLKPDGTTIGVYRKIHLFDVEMGDELSFRESDSVAAGDVPVVFELNGFTVGVSVCYDLRFPELYRGLVDLGANILIVPAAFTMQTGRDHWHALLKARAIENQCYVVAPNQYGNHFGNRVSFGQSAIYDPWGRLIASCSDGENIAIAEISRDLIDRTRKRLPCLQHRKV